MAKPSRDDLVAKQTRADRLHATVSVAQRMKLLLDRECTDWFDARDRDLVNNLLAASDDDRRREAAAELRAWRNVRTMIATVAQQESYAVKKLKEIANAG